MKIQKGKLETQCVSFILSRRHMLTPFCRLMKGALFRWIVLWTDLTERGAPVLSRMELRSQGTH